MHDTTIYNVFARWSDDSSLEHACIASVAHLSNKNQLDLSILHGDGTNTVAKKGGDGIGYFGHKHQKDDKAIAMVDNNGYILAPLPGKQAWWRPAPPLAVVWRSGLGFE